MSLAIDTDGLTCQSRDQRIWNGARSTKGVKGKGVSRAESRSASLDDFLSLAAGRYYFEATQTDANGIVRIGWSVPMGQLDLGTDNQGFGFGGTGKKSFAKQFDDYGETFGVNDAVGSLLDLDQMKIRFFKNGSLVSEVTPSTAERLISQARIWVTHSIFHVHCKKVHSSHTSA